MSRPPVPTEDHAACLLAALSGLALTASSALAADLAREHMATLGALCGVDAHAHCGWCYAAAALALAGLAALAAAVRPAHQSGMEPRRPR